MGVWVGSELETKRRPFNLFYSSFIPVYLFLCDAMSSAPFLPPPFHPSPTHRLFYESPRVLFHDMPLQLPADRSLPHDHDPLAPALALAPLLPTRPTVTRVYPLVGLFQVHDPLAYALALALLAYPIPAAYRNCTKCPHIGLPESSSSLYANCQPFNTYTVFGIIVRVIELFFVFVALLGSLGVLSVGAVRVAQGQGHGLSANFKLHASDSGQDFKTCPCRSFSSSVRPAGAFLHPTSSRLHSHFVQS